MKPIHTPEEHAEALKTIQALWGAKPGTPEGDEFEVLSILVDAYESEHFPIPPPENNTLHVHAQYYSHLPAYLVGTKESLTQLRVTIDRALQANRPEFCTTFAADGEGYQVIVIPVEKLGEDALLPYSDFESMADVAMSPGSRLNHEDWKRLKDLKDP